VKKLIAIAVFALVMLGAAGAGTVESNLDNEPIPVPTCGPSGPKC
jgi:hypothetical protein